MFGFGKPKHQVVTDFASACTILSRMGLNISERSSDEKKVQSVIVQKNGLAWVFAGDTEIFTIARSFRAPENFDANKLQEWMLKKNFVSVIYDPKKGVFIMVTNILLEGGLIIQNVARLVFNFDIYISAFMQHMKLNQHDLLPLE